MKRTSFAPLIILLALLPIGLRAQAPRLGICASFALFTPVGALSNTGGLTRIVGDIGTDSGTISDYPVGSIMGTQYQEDVVTDTATVHVRKAYAYLLALPCTGPSLAPAMGASQLLAPGTYCQAGASSVAGDLILDGQNQSNSLFVFKINGALTTAASTRVLLINGARAGNVYWQVEGATSFAAATEFVGTIITHGAIAFGDGVSLKGRGFSTMGAISTFNNLITSPGAAPMPVELVAFTARGQGSTAVALAWSTASEKNSAHFEVERSANGTTFTRIGTVAAAGNSSTPRTYSWSDETLSAQATPLYYRLRQLDANGTANYSPVRTVWQTFAAASHFVVYPNPAHEVIRIQVLGSMLTEPVQLLDASGRTLPVPPAGADGIISLTELSAGLYMLRCGSLAQRLTLE